MHHDLLDQLDGINGQMKISARVLGRKARAYLLKSETLSFRVFGLLERHLIHPESSEIIRNWARAKDINLEDAAYILKEFETGLKKW